MAVFCGFCVSFHASSYCMLTEIKAAVMFQNFDKYIIFNKVALIGLCNFIANGLLFFRVFDHSTELEAYSELCQRWGVLQDDLLDFFGFFFLHFMNFKTKTTYINYIHKSSVKQSHPGHFLKSQGKFFLSFSCTLFYIFLTPKNYKSSL